MARNLFRALASTLAALLALGAVVAAPSAAARVGLVASLTPTMTTNHTSVDQLYVGHPQGFTVSVIPAPDGGTLSLKTNGTTVVSQPAESGGAFLVWTPSVTGTFSLVAEFSGTATYAPSTSTAQTVTVNPPLLDAVYVESSTGLVNRNVDVTFTATVTPNPGGGSIEWRNFGQKLTTTPVNANGVATLVTSFADTGSYSIDALFTGTANWSPHGSNSVGLIVVGDPVSISASVPSDPMAAGAVTATVTVTPDPGAGVIRVTPVGSSNYTEQGVGPGGVTSMNVGTLGPGYYQYDVEFLGTPDFAYASTDLAFSVWSPTATTLTTNRSTATVGELPVVLTAAASSVDGKQTSGSITFRDDVGGVVIDLATIPVGVSTGAATFSSSSLRVGVHTITAVFNAPMWYLDSTSPPITVTVSADGDVHATFGASLATFYPTSDGYLDTVKLGGTLDEPATVTINVYNATGALKRTFSLGSKPAGAYSATWNGKTAGGTALPAGTYKAVATIKDTQGHSKNLTAYTTVNWRKATWKSGTFLRYADTGVYSVRNGGALYASPDYPRGRILDSGSMVRDCTNCGWASGEFSFGLAEGALAYRGIFVQVRGHGFQDREHSGQTAAYDWAKRSYTLWFPNAEFDQPGLVWGDTIPPTKMSNRALIKVRVWMTQRWGDAYDLYFVKLTYEYAVWA